LCDFVDSINDCSFFNSCWENSFPITQFFQLDNSQLVDFVPRPQLTKNFTVGKIALDPFESGIPLINIASYNLFYVCDNVSRNNE